MVFSLTLINQCYFYVVLFRTILSFWNLFSDSWRKSHAWISIDFDNEIRCQVYLTCMICRIRDAVACLGGVHRLCVGDG